MTLPMDEDEQLRSVAMQTAREILCARQKVERELLESKAGLEKRTIELASAISLLKATLEATADGLLVTTTTRELKEYNHKYLDMWGLDEARMASLDHAVVYEWISLQFADPGAFLRRISDIYQEAPVETLDILELKDGRVIERYSMRLTLDEQTVGRVWSFREITERVRAENALQEESRVLEELNRAGSALVSSVDIKSIVQAVTDSATALTGADFGAFFYNTLDENGESYVLYTLSGADRDAFARFPMPRATALFGHTFRGERSIRADDIQEHPDFGHSPPHFGMPPGHLPVRSYLAIPVISRSGLVQGGLFFGAAASGIFTERHERLVAGLAAQAAIAIDNTNLHENSRQAQIQLQHMNQTLEQQVQERTAALLTTERQFRQLVNGIHDCAIYMLDIAGNIMTWNPGAERIKGYSREEVIGQHFSMFYTREARAKGAPKRSLEIAARNGKYEEEGWRLRKGEQRFWVSVLIEAVHDEAGSLVGFAKITRDMTAQRAIQEQLQQSQKMEAIGQLTGGVAHDFNNLLQVISGQLQLLAKDLAGNSKATRHVQNAMEGVIRGSRLATQLLAFGRRQSLTPTVVNIGRFIREAAGLLRRAVGEGVVVETVVTPGLWNTLIDAGNLENALLNLAINARDAMDAHGQLKIEAGNVSLYEEYTHALGDVSAGEYVELSVTDTGCGMPPEIASRVFEPFFSTKPEGEGTGLGLSMVYGFVKQSGGHIRVHSELGQGTTFKIYLPRSSRAEDVVIEVEHRAAEGGTETILVAEDDPAVRETVVATLKDLGYRVLKAKDGAGALKIIESGAPVDLLFTDVVMPGPVKSTELVERARQRLPDLPVLFTSGYTSNVISRNNMLDKDKELISKPYTRDALARKLRQVLGNGTSRAAAHSLMPGFGAQRALPAMKNLLFVVCEDNEIIRMNILGMLEELGHSGLGAEDARTALAILSDNKVDALITDIGLPDSVGTVLARQARSLIADLPIIFATGYGDTLSVKEWAPASLLSKPFDLSSLEKSIAAVIDKARTQQT